ncbi:hypothetical protein [Bosea sp. 124]|uniref:hypothetical protein n=1 Tax=Bosea sp. 124 TaxID=2135642 RepID=UPI0011B2825F|nr:hypothetical protein [Bosea sp. 124]
MTVLGGPVSASEWIGGWGAPSCGRDAVVIRLGPKELDLSTFETTCSTRSAKKLGDVYELTADCSGEGRPIRVSFTVRVQGDVLTFVRQRGFDFDPKRYRRCG